MNAFERLRYVARLGGANPGLLGAEAAAAFAQLAENPPALVTACRRLVATHPDCAPLWWAAARVLTAADPREVALDIERDLARDETAEELGAAIASGAVVAAAATEAVALGLAIRPDLACRLVGTNRALRSLLPYFSDSVEIEGYLPDELEDAIVGATLVVVEAVAAGPSGFLLDRTAYELVTEGAALGVEVLVLVGEGHLLPEPLFRACARLTARRAATAPERDVFGELGHATGEHVIVEASAARLVVGPTGVEPTALALARARCAAPAELVNLEPVSQDLAG